MRFRKSNRPSKFGFGFGSKYLLLALIPFASVTSAQELVNIRVSPSEVGLGEKVEIAVSLKHVDNFKVCGLNIDFGDGTDEYVRVEDARLNFTLTHVYKQPGSVAIKIEGKTRFQGISTSFSCRGDTKTAAVTVLPDDFAAKRAAAIAQKEAALKQAEIDKAAALAASNSAQKTRAEAELANKTAKNDKAAAEKLSKENAAKRAVAATQQKALTAPATLPPKPATPQSLPLPPALLTVPSAPPVAPKPATAQAPDPAPKPSTAAPKAKSSLDL